MKLWILSDLHIDANRRYPLALPDPRPEHDAVIVAGDICRGVADGVRFIVHQRWWWRCGEHRAHSAERNAPSRPFRQC